MFPGLMAVKFNLFALPVLEGDGEQGLLQSRCPKLWEPPATVERGRGFSHHIPLGFCENKDLWPSRVGDGLFRHPPASRGYSASSDIPGALTTPRPSHVHPASPALHTDFSRLISKPPCQARLPPPSISIYYDYFAFITRRARALPHLKSCAKFPLHHFPHPGREGLHSLQ